MFNLIDEPWILAQCVDGPRELSLRQVFRDADSVRRVTGDVPTQGFAILRLLLAICHDAIGWHTIDAMNRLRDHGIDLAPIDGYLDEWHDRFELLDTERPFFQVADLATAKGEYSGLEKLIADVPNGEPFFTTRAGNGLASIPPAEAARWLVHVHAFDPSGIRSGAVGDQLVTGGKGYPIGPAWAGQLGGIVQHGANLRETLACNLTRTSGDAADRPPWALAEPHTARRSAEAIPAGPVQLLVWQSRRVRLVPNPDRSAVIGLVLSQGDKMTPQNRHGVEPMSGWRFSDPQTKKFKRTVYMPKKHDPGRAFWRGLPSVLIPPAGDIKTEESGTVARFIAPATFESVSDELADRVILQAIGIEYGGNEATIEEIIDDSVEVDSSLLGEESGAIRAVISDSVGNAESCVRLLGNLAANLARAAGEKGDKAGEGDRNRAMEEAWAALDQPARRWIGALTAESDPEESQSAWQRTLADILWAMGDALATAASMAAVRGRETSHGFMNAPKAQMYFRAGMRKELPLVYAAKEAAS